MSVTGVAKTTTERLIICRLDGDMEELKDLLNLLFGFAAVALCVWLYLRLSLFFFERGLTVRRSPRLEIQTLFHGKTKDDKDQI